jgi:hypothetical protein
MSNQLDSDMFARELFLAGELVPPGLYEQVDSTRVVQLDLEGFLPASLDGKVACFVPMHRTWGQIQQFNLEPSTIRAHAARPSSIEELSTVSSGSKSNASHSVLRKRGF